MKTGYKHSDGHEDVGSSHRGRGKDTMAHSSHHEHNAEHGMTEGFCPKGECCYEGKKKHGAEGMKENEKHEADHTEKKAKD